MAQSMTSCAIPPLNATGFFKPTSGQKPVLIQNQFGGTIGGPIIKERTFFFFDYEGFRRSPRSHVTRL